MKRNLCGLLESFRFIPNLWSLKPVTQSTGSRSKHLSLQHVINLPKLEVLVINQTGSEEDLNHVKETIEQAKPQLELGATIEGRLDIRDDMGLGKTLQCISLIWTLHKQGMYGGNHSVKRTLIITPGSLVKEFMNSPLYPVMIISYEMFLRSVEEVRNIKFGLVICDEAHRLKNTTIKTATNDLKEFHSLVDVCNPGILGAQSCFRRLYEEPSSHGQQPDATSEEKLLGQTRAAELNRLTSMFFLRRTSEVNSRYLPPKGTRAFNDM
ncbi:DNA repair and recombination protein rad54b [Desmophyllum pertusum]|uniref:DNA repair and recombination protein rad54b n=1 Tax=Desmophyllum pertusum TaxID=174260 RepID=A0A9X0CQW8_9CNID|nr:DNA repair and recombination protein rad54b [Desmophyllum pertusum]